MKVEFELCGSERQIALKIIPETDFERTYLRRSFQFDKFMMEGKEALLLYMSGDRLVKEKP